mmetsp:Transcript_14935/g.18757  ORF Transcript_14935/g.18757 Transcript_14935/m.18757 type:complete len:535 (+) Transcript_14935:359-1963(+)
MDEEAFTEQRKEKRTAIEKALEEMNKQKAEEEKLSSAKPDAVRRKTSKDRSAIEKALEERNKMMAEEGVIGPQSYEQFQSSTAFIIQSDTGENNKENRSSAKKKVLGLDVIDNCKDLEVASDSSTDTPSCVSECSQEMKKKVCTNESELVKTSLLNAHITVQTHARVGPPRTPRTTKKPSEKYHSTPVNAKKQPQTRTRRNSDLLQKNDSARIRTKRSSSTPPSPRRIKQEQLRRRCNSHDSITSNESPRKSSHASPYRKSNAISRQRLPPTPTSRRTTTEITSSGRHKTPTRSELGMRALSPSPIKQRRSSTTRKEPRTRRRSRQTITPKTNSPPNTPIRLGSRTRSFSPSPRKHHTSKINSGTHLPTSSPSKSNSPRSRTRSFSPSLRKHRQVTPTIETPDAILPLPPARKSTHRPKKNRQPPPPPPPPPKRTIPLYNGRSIPTTPTRKTVTYCALKWDPVKHPSNGGCDRCLHFASAKEVKQFQETGHHFRIIRSRGGCGHNCSFFPRREDENCVRLCRKCFYDTHELKRW